MVETKENKTRQANMELLRSVCMLMVITLHYLDKGGALTKLTEASGILDRVPWLLESFSIVAVNTYILISGFFTTPGSFRIKKWMGLWCQILFYTWMVPLVLAALHIISFSGMEIYDWLIFFFPIQMNHYWFATSYLILALFAPVLSMGVEQLPKKTMTQVLIMLLLVVSVGKSVIPFVMDLDKGGYDALWFLCMFLTGAYLRKYGCRWIGNFKSSLILYLTCGLSIFVWANLISFLVVRTGRGEYFISNTFLYNHILCYAGSIGLFLTFWHLRISSRTLQKVILFIAPYTFGVYLLHENSAIRYLWPEWFMVEENAKTAWFIPHYLGTVCMIFLVGILVDFMRSRIFALADRAFAKIKREVQ